MQVLAEGSSQCFVLIGIDIQDMVFPSLYAMLFPNLCESCSFVFNSLRPHGLQPAKVLSPWNSSGQNTGMGSQFLLQGLPNPGIEHRSPELQADSLAAELSGKAFSKLIYGFIECLIHH